MRGVMCRTTASLLCAVAVWGCGAVDAPDAGVDGGVDAWALDAAPRQEPRVVWAPSTPLDCTAHMRAPAWRPPAEPGPVGSVRWTQRFSRDVFRVVHETYDPPIEPSTFLPLATDDGTVLWTLGDWAELGFRYTDGEFVHYGQSSEANTPHETPRGTWYTSYPRLWLPHPAGIYARDTWSPIGLRAGGPLVPTLSVDLSGLGDSEWRPYRNGRTAMPAWSPVTGARIQFAVGGEEGGVASVCTEGVQWITSIPFDFRQDFVRPILFFVRPDGDVIVATRFEMWVLDGSNGEPLRHGQYGDDPSTIYSVGGNPVTYHPNCGVLVEEETGSQWYWVDDDTMERGRTITAPEEYAGGAWVGTPDCGVTLRSRYRVIRLDAEGQVRFDVPLGPGFDGPIPTARGGFAFLGSSPPGWVELDENGVELQRVQLDPRVVGESSISLGLLAPDGTYYFATDSGLGLVLLFGAASTGMEPGPFLWPESGLNWAHTNSYF